jgi:hypothetical protein
MAKIMQKAPFILYITGISTAGKTTTYEALKSDPELSYLEFHDIEENGVPPAGSGSWRVFRVEELLFGATNRLKQGTSTVICGITQPHEVIRSKFYDPTLNVHFLLLDIPLNLFAQRLEARKLDHMKDTTASAESLPDYWENCLLQGRRLARELRNEVSSLKNGHIFNTATMSETRMITEAKELVKLL